VLGSVDLKKERQRLGLEEEKLSVLSHKQIKFRISVSLNRLKKF